VVFPENAARTALRRSWFGVLALIGCATLWSLNGPLIKLLDRAEVPGITIACYRSLLGGLVFLPIAARRWRTLRLVSIGWPIGSVLTFTLMTSCFVIATTQTAAANAIILQYTSPIWVFLLSPVLLRERFRLSDGLVLVLAMTGVAIIFLGHATGDVPALSIGLASGLGYGSLTVALRGLRRADPSTVVALNFVGSGLLLLPPVAIWGIFLLNGYQFVLVLVLSVVQMAIPYLLFSWALQRVEAHRAALIVLLETVLNPLWTYLIVHEPVPEPTLIGGPLILLSVISWLLLTWRRETLTRQRRGASMTAPLPQRSSAKL
jgi:DME family drug/metabolite transporter